MKRRLISAALVGGLFVSPVQAQKVGALAVDKENGFAYGFAFDHLTRSEAEARALEEVTKRGGKGSVVLVWSGEGCGAYRTIDPKDGNAFGWGVAATQLDAELTADREFAKRAKGKVAMNRAWACNSKSPQKMKIIKNSINENFRTVKIGSRTWTAENANIDRFQNGDAIPKFPNFETFNKVSVQKKPASYCYSSDPSCSKFGRFYNLWAVIDPRGFAPDGWAVPNAEDYQSLINAMGGTEQAVARLRTSDGWPEVADPVSAPTGFDAVATGHPATSKPDFFAAFFWTTSSVGEGKIYRNHAILTASSGADLARIGTQDGYEPLSVRFIAK